ncbi:MAG: 2-phospho-L-lactate transferase CofD family protein [Chloroflexales bacterium]
MPILSRRISRLGYLAVPITLIVVGVAALLFGAASLLAIQLTPLVWRDTLLILGGLAALGFAIWQLGGLTMPSISDSTASPDGELVVGFRHADKPPQVVVLSGGAGILVLASLGDHVARMTCIVPTQDPVEYYYRAAGLFNFQNVYYVVPAPTPLDVIATLDDGTVADVRRLAANPQIAERHVTQLSLRDPAAAAALLPRMVAEAIHDADAIILGPGSLYESVLPNMLIDSFREALGKSAARKLYICNLMTEPGRTTGFSVADHIREIKRYAGFAPDYVLVNVQRIDADVHRLYAAAHQSPVYLSPEEYEETAVLSGDRDGQRRLVIEGSVVIEADLASSVIQYTATLANPDQSRAVHVLRHDADKLTATILELLRRT